MTPRPPLATIALGPTGSSEVRFGHLDVLAAIAGLSFLVARFVPVLGLFPGCAFRALLKIPCATCGMTHAFVALAHGDVASAVRSSPLGALTAAAAWVFALVAVLRPLLRFRWPALAPSAARVAAVASAVALLVNWGWLVAGRGAHP